MAVLLAAFLVLSIVTPSLTNWLSTRVFYLIAALPFAAFIVTLAQGPLVLGGAEATERYPWMPLLDVWLSFRVDALAWVLALVVTGVGALVLLYCARYFSADEPGLGRFAALLLAFAGTMYGLVVSDDIIVMFMFWEITSILSYLLIGHYTGRKESRGAALQALLVTTFGGLVMLIGVVMMMVETGTSSIAAMVADPPHGAVTATAVILILVGALSKSAIVPFHFWLPAAMAAPTPVSAYLHAAAMVKAGIYLVGRFAPGYADSPGWMPTLMVLGVGAMLVGAWRSLRQYDLKLVLAYGTVSQLGFLMVISGFGTHDAALAAVALLIGHALYKATLFLVVGIIDHRAGTRDWRKLSGVGRSAPVLATVAALACLSMAGVPPLLGFVAKEGVFSSLLDAAFAGDGWALFALIGTAIGSVLTVAYTCRFFWGAFARRADVETTQLAPDGGSILTAPIVLTIGTVAFGLGAGLLDPVIAPYAQSFTDDGHAHIALWHGWQPALALSAIVLGLGFVLFWQRTLVARLQDVVPAWFEAARGYWLSMRTIDRLAARSTIFAQRGGLSQYLSTILVVFVALVAVALAVNDTWPSGIRLYDYPAQIVIGLVMATASVLAALAGQRMTAVLLVGVTGYGLVALFALHGAPDLAITQGLVEMATIVIFVLVLRRLPVKIAQHNRPEQKKRRALIGILVGVTMGVVGTVALAARQAESIAAELPRLAVEEGHGRNIVNVMLVDIRAWDTMGEISVLVVVATGIASLLFVSGRLGAMPRMEGSRSQRRRANRRHVVKDPLAPAEEPTETRHTWIFAGRTLSTDHRSILLEVVIRLLFHPAILVSVYLLFVGHNAPGGGFAGGLLAGLALIARYLAGGRFELAEAVTIDAGKILGTGIVLAAGTAAASLFFGADILTSAYIEGDVPLLGHLSFGTSTIFDIGVYLVVVGLILDILRSLGGEVDRQLEDSEVTLEARGGHR
ncbi:multisubunit sodium/proton antiporter, MrpA subunit /multisubunit sodium/proton antiporter, MrpB subunit [Paramicrobacterium humi]|uniref:Multisubunit sodium/proton antiporter, MrpA subunit /multisubunit sodium/proton antiporter, MrpB subunit n=1 Tax=Paramicrobacterium humi TaxID=640635 RepID=A0A1H4IVX4_9MICO|nr:Na+/H+ antiporter subunit A [Microbacterium humi]SEB38173.1 multisubunit sodium/proton antiporter, MrpA subunit /multisubunit sodium/proton antiporter, MrpB subunit [Microbacterium humi]